MQNKERPAPAPRASSESSGSLQEISDGPIRGCSAARRWPTSRFRAASDARRSPAGTTATSTARSWPRRATRTRALVVSNSVVLRMARCCRAASSSRRPSGNPFASVRQRLRAADRVPRASIVDKVFGRMPLQVYFDVVQNLGASAEETGYWAGISAGALRQRGDWAATVVYATCPPKPSSRCTAIRTSDQAAPTSRGRSSSSSTDPARTSLCPAGTT